MLAVGLGEGSGGDVGKPRGRTWHFGEQSMSPNGFWESQLCGLSAVAEVQSFPALGEGIKGIISLFVITEGGRNKEEASIVGNCA